MRLHVRFRWSLSLYPDAAEAGGSMCAGAGGGVVVGSAVDPERAAAEAARRARAALRRYAVANRLNRFGTLTYAGAGCHDPRQVRRDVADFFRSLRPALGGQRFPYVWVPEWHPGGHGLHLHFLVGQYVSQRLIRRLWGHGHVFIKLIGDLPVGSGTLEEARAAAGYAAKYVAKGASDDRRPQGLHRYEVAQGFQPQRLRLFGQSAEDVLRQASAVMKSEPTTVWRSSEREDWHGPPACWAAWAQ